MNLFFVVHDAIADATASEPTWVGAEEWFRQFEGQLTLATTSVLERCAVPCSCVGLVDGVASAAAANPPTPTARPATPPIAAAAYLLRCLTFPPPQCHWTRFAALRSTPFARFMCCPLDSCVGGPPWLTALADGVCAIPSMSATATDSGGQMRSGMLASMQRISRVCIATAILASPLSSDRHVLALPTTAEDGASCDGASCDGASSRAALPSAAVGRSARRPFPAVPGGSAPPTRCQVNSSDPWSSVSTTIRIRRPTSMGQRVLISSTKLVGAASILSAIVSITAVSSAKVPFLVRSCRAATGTVSRGSTRPVARFHCASTCRNSSLARVSLMSASSAGGRASTGTRVPRPRESAETWFVNQIF